MRIPRYVGWPLVGASAYGALYMLANRIIFQPMRYPAGRWEVQGQLDAEDVWLRTPDGVKLHGWWKEANGARVVTLYLHGNAGNVSHRGMHIREIAAAGSSVLVLDYRGYGKSEGKPTEKGLYVDADTAFQYLTARGYRSGQVVLHGESLGTAVAVDLAARTPVGGVILEAPFTSAADVAGGVLPLVGSLVVRGFNSEAKIARVGAPLLLIHGQRDEVIEPHFGRALFAAAREPKQFWAVPGAGHNDIVETAGAEYRERLRAFYSAIKGQP